MKKQFILRLRDGGSILGGCDELFLMTRAPLQLQPEDGGPPLKVEQADRFELQGVEFERVFSEEREARPVDHFWAKLVWADFDPAPTPEALAERERRVTKEICLKLMEYHGREFRGDDPSASENPRVKDFLRTAEFIYNNWVHAYEQTAFRAQEKLKSVRGWASEGAKRLEEFARREEHLQKKLERAGNAVNSETARAGALISRNARLAAENQDLRDRLACAESDAEVARQRAASATAEAHELYAKLTEARKHIQNTNLERATLANSNSQWKSECKELQSQVTGLYERAQQAEVFLVETKAALDSAQERADSFAILVADIFVLLRGVLPTDRSAAEEKMIERISSYQDEKMQDLIRERLEHQRAKKHEAPQYHPFSFHNTACPAILLSPFARREDVERACTCR